MKQGLQPTHTGRLDPKIRRIWEDLGRIGPQYTLIGGTAIALYCNHRQSVDVDLSCRRAAEHPRTIRRSIRAEIGKHKVLQRRTGIVIKFFATETSPKIEIHGTDPWKMTAPPLRAENGLYVAAPCDLAARKLAAMIERDSPRDGEDLEALVRGGADIGAAARNVVAQVDPQSLERLGERLQQNPQERWPKLEAHKGVLASLQNGRNRCHRAATESHHVRGKGFPEVRLDRGAPRIRTQGGIDPGPINPRGTRMARTKQTVSRPAKSRSSNESLNSSCSENETGAEPGESGPVRDSVAAGSTRPGRVPGLPAGITRAAGAGWERPPTGSRRAWLSPDCGAVDPTFGGGSLPAPLSAQNGESGSGGCERTAAMPTGFETHVARTR